VIPTLNAGDSTTLTFQFQSLQTGKVVASYLHFDTSDGTTGNLNFTLGVFANGTPDVSGHAGIAFLGGQFAVRRCRCGDARIGPSVERGDRADVCRLV